MSRIRLWAAGAVVAVIAMLAMPTVASAHDQLIHSTPAVNDALATAPTAIELDFSANVLDEGAEIRVVDADGTDFADGDLAIDGSTVTIAVRSDMPEAGYQVRWRVVSSDGHPISGLIPFTIGDAAPMPLPTATAADGEATGETAASGTAGAADATPGDAGVLRTVLIGAGGAVVALAVLLGVGALRRRSRRADGAAPTDGATPTDSNS